LTVLMTLSPDALLLVDQAGTLVMANEQAASLFGYTVEQLQEHPLEMLLPELQRTLHIAHRLQFMSQPSTRSMGGGFSLVGLRRDGHEFPVDVSLRPVLFEDRLLVIGAVRDMSELRRIEREQAQHSHLQAELLDLTHDAILVRDSLSRVTYWTKGAQALYGWNAQQAQGRITHHLLHTRFPVDLASVEVALQREGCWEGELTHTCRDGRVVVVESRQALLRDEAGQTTAMLEINRDITRRRELEQAAHVAHVETSERLLFLQRVLDALPSSVYLVYGSQARLLLANHAALRYWGADWPLNQPMREFLAATGIQLLNEQGVPLRPEQYATLRAVQQGETVLSQQETIRRPGESSLPVVVSALPLSARPATGQLAEASEPMALVLHQDVSALKQAEYLKDEFIGVAAHELRNPLAALKGYASMLQYQTARGRGAKLSAWQRDALEEIEQATGRLDKLTEDLLDVTRLQAGRLVLLRKPLDLVVLTRRMMEQAQMSSQHHAFSFDSTLPSLLVKVDRVRIEQVLSNLLSNAMKYSPQGSMIAVSLHEDSEAHVALLAIRDEGMGIPASQQARMFGRFVRAENARASEITGTGLGLYLSRELVERHGGRLWFESTEGVGSTFFFTLPLQ
jgi:PAS domain S-box-containing protein